MGQDDVQVEPNEFGRQRGEARLSPLRPSRLHANILSLHIAEVAQPVPERSHGSREGGKGADPQEPNAGHFPWWLCVGREADTERERHHEDRGWPTSISEMPTPQLPHWSTSSARMSTDCGIVKPRALAVVRLMTNSNVVGRSMGSSAGFVPLRILSTYVAARR